MIRGTFEHGLLVRRIRDIYVMRFDTPKILLSCRKDKWPKV